MATVRLEVMPMLADLFGAPAAEHLSFQEPIREGETLRDLLNHLVAAHHALDDVVFDAQHQRMTEFVRIMLNNEMVELTGGLDVPLAEDDEVLFLPAFAGG